MNYRQMGRTGLRLSSVSIGGWLTFGGTVDERGTRDILRAAVDEGVNFIDLADVYSKGACEAAVGACLGEFRREDLVVSSKVFGRMGDGPNDRGLSRKHIMESVDASLRRIGTDYLDIYFCHRPDPETPLDETARAMDDLVHQGKVHYWGTSVWAGELLDGAHDLCDRRGLYAPMVEQPQYSLPSAGSRRGPPGGAAPGDGPRGLEPPRRRLAHREVRRGRPGWEPRCRDQMVGRQARRR